MTLRQGKEQDKRHVKLDIKYSQYNKFDLSSYNDFSFRLIRSCSYIITLIRKELLAKTKTASH